MASTPSDVDGPPPPYITSNEDLVQPAILVLSGRFIHAQTSTGVPLYELSQDVTQSSEGETKAELSRVIHSVRTNASGAPRATQRSRHIFDLKRLPPLLSQGFPYCLDAVTRSAAGNFGLKDLSFPRTGFKIVRLEPDNREDGLPKGYKARRKSSKEGGSVFEMRKAHDHREWIGPDGDRIAVEDDTTDDLKLIVTQTMSRTMVDALVASWCLKIWHNQIESSAEMSQGSRAHARKVRDILPRFW